MKRLLLTAILFSGVASGAGIDWQSIWSIDRADFKPYSTYSSTTTVAKSTATYGSVVDWLKADKVSLTNTVNDLAKSGLLCEVLGHKWDSGCGIEARGYGCLVNHGPARHCSMCGKEQYLEPEVWK